MDITRRTVLQGAGALTVSFLVPGFPVPAEETRDLPGDLKTHPLISAWLRIEADERVTLMIGKVELGQGILTAIQQICADELDVDFSRITVISGDTAITPDEGVTAGSRSMEQCGSAVRQAAAEARHILLELAAKRLSTPIEALEVEDGRITAPGGQSVHYWDLVQGSELQREAAGTIRPKPRSAYRYVGKSVPRVDLAAKIMGEPIFLQEIQREGLVHGRVVRPPTYTAVLQAVTTGAVEAMPGVLKVVRDGSFLGVIAEREEQAIAAADALAKAAEWKTGEDSLPGQDGIYDWLLAQSPQTTVIKDEKPAAKTAAAKTVSATYYRPYQMHASIGPSAAIAEAKEDGTLLIDTHSQSVTWTADSIADMLGLDRSKVRARHVQGSGCYGHNLADDAAADAALLAQALPGRPVRLLYSRADEHRWEPYGSAMVVRTRAGLDDEGNILDWNVEVYSTPHNTRPNRQAGFLLPAGHLAKSIPTPTPRNVPAPAYGSDRNAIVLYDFPAHRVVNHFVTAMPLRVSALRGLGAYGNVFATESFMDELAFEAQADPVDYRLRFLRDERARAVLAKAAEAFGWSSFEKRPGHGRGIAFAQYKNLACYTAVALEVAVDRPSGAVRVVRAVAGNDSGEIVNPDGVENQIEGGIIQSLSWSLKEEVPFDTTRVFASDWNDYPILRFSEVPPVVVVQIDRPGEPFLGTGEGSQGPAVAALANAIFDAVGVRLRQLPFTPERVKSALAT